jgi:hypothetical protein
MYLLIESLVQKPQPICAWSQERVRSVARAQRCPRDEKGRPLRPPPLLLPEQPHLGRAPHRRRAQTRPGPLLLQVAHRDGPRAGGVMFPTKRIYVFFFLFDKLYYFFRILS